MPDFLLYITVICVKFVTDNNFQVVQKKLVCYNYNTRGRLPMKVASPNLPDDIVYLGMIYVKMLF